MNAQQLQLFGAMLAAQARVLGMCSENMQRQATGDSMAYGEEAFSTEAQHLETLAYQAANS